MNKTKTFFKSMAVMKKRAYLYLLAIFGMSISFALFSVMGSLLMKTVVDNAASGDYRRLLWMVAAVVCAGLLSLLLYRRCAIIYNVEAKRVFGYLSGEVLDEELHLIYDYYEKHHSGEIISKISYDLTGMGAIYGSRFRRVVMPILEVIVFLIPMLCYCWQLALCLVFVNVIILITDVLFVNPIHRITRRLSEINKSMTEHISDILNGILTIRMFSAGQKKLEKFQDANRQFYDKKRSHVFISSSLEGITNGCNLLSLLLFLLLGIYFVNMGVTTLGSIAGIYAVYGRFSRQFLMIGKYIPELSGCIANAENIFAFLSEEREPENWYSSDKKPDYEAENDFDGGGALLVQDVTFAYDRDNYILKNFSLKVMENECVAITGASGCGKTTLSKLILGLYPVSSGSIVVNGKDIRNHTLGSIRSEITYVPQDAYLFEGTVMENISYGNENATRDDIEYAAKMANAHDFIMEMENGYDSVINEGGTNLSGGQRQRIAIARAAVSKAGIILLDEATSALDGESEYRVNQALRNMQGQKTIIMIAHRPATIAMADRVVEMKK